MRKTTLFILPYPHTKCKLQSDNNILVLLRRREIIITDCDLVHNSVAPGFRECRHSTTVNTYLSKHNPVFITLDSLSKDITDKLNAGAIGTARTRTTLYRTKDDKLKEATEPDSGVSDIELNDFKKYMSSINFLTDEE